MVPEGTQDVPVNDVIAVLAGDGEDVTAAGAGAAKPEAAKPGARPSQTPAAPASVRSACAAPSRRGGRASARSEGEAAHTNGRVFSSPLARRLAKDAGIDFGRVNGTGPHGRVIARDVEQAKAGGALKAPASAPSCGPAIAPSMSDQQIRALLQDGTYDEAPHDSMRRTIAQRLVQAKQTIPHFYLTIDCNLDRLMAAREEINAAGAEGQGQQAGLQAVGQRLRHQGDGAGVAARARRQRHLDRGGDAEAPHSDVGVAVSIPGGLITPMMRDATSNRCRRSRAR